jgi:hypothetical protein
MRFDLPMTAFALESSGAAACALSGAHTLTLPLEAAEAGEARGLLALAETAAASAWQLAVATESPAPLTLTL